MYEYFGVGLEIREEVIGIFPRFLRWLPKHRLSTPSRRSLEIWCLVIDNLIANDVIPFSLFFIFFIFYFLALSYGLVFSNSRLLCGFLDVFGSLG